MSTTMWVTRENGSITGVFGRPQYADQEMLPNDDAEIVAFLEAINAEPSNELLYDQSLQQNKVLRALITALNEGALTPGLSITETELKAIICSKM